MLYCQLILLKGKGNASLTFRTQPHLDTRIIYALRGLPAGGTLLVGDGEQRHAVAVSQAKGTLDVAPLVIHSLWAAYLDADGVCLAWGTADGRWHEYVAMHLYDYAREIAAPAPRETQTGKADLADFGVIAVEFDAPESDALSLSHPQVEAPTSNETVDRDVAPTVAREDEIDEATVETARPDSDVSTAHTGKAQPLFAEDVERLLAAFDEYPPYAPLMSQIPDSRWVEVGDEGAGYLLGLLHDSASRPTHLVYGVRGQRNRPFAEDAEWLSAEGLAQDEGYWLVYYNL